MEAAWRAVLRKGARLVCTRWYRPPGCGWEAEVRANSGACRWRWRWTRTCTSSDSSLPTRIRPYRIRGVPMVQTVFRRFSVRWRWRQRSPRRQRRRRRRSDIPMAFGHAFGFAALGRLRGRAACAPRATTPTCPTASGAPSRPRTLEASSTWCAPRATRLAWASTSSTSGW
jgi:hypothetical protein